MRWLLYRVTTIQRVRCNTECCVVFILQAGCVGGVWEVLDEAILVATADRYELAWERYAIGWKGIVGVCVCVMRVCVCVCV